jgi:hypothetical protein
MKTTEYKFTLESILVLWVGMATVNAALIADPVRGTGYWDTVNNGGFENGLTGWGREGGPGGGPINGDFSASSEHSFLGS